MSWQHIVILIIMAAVIFFAIKGGGT